MKKILVLLVVLLAVVGSCGPVELPSPKATTDDQVYTMESPSDTTVQAATDTDGSEARKPISDEDRAEIAEKYGDDPVKYNAAMYAKLMGISLDEALYRLDMQGKAGPFGAELEKNESATLTGFWIEHEPEFRLVASFTKNGEETIEKYRDKYPDLVAITTVVNAKYTQEQLIATHNQVIETLRKVGLNFSSSTDVINNRVEIYVTDNELFESTLETHNIQLPDCVVPVIIYEPLKGTPPGLNPEPSVHMAQLKVKSGASMEALMTGILTVVDSYLRVDQHLIIWQPDLFVHNNDGQIEIWNRDGNVVGIVGQGIRMGGGEGHGISGINSSLTEPLPDYIEGPTWIQGAEPSVHKTEREILAEKTVDEILEKVTEFCDNPGNYIEDAGIERLKPDRPEYVDPDEARYDSAFVEFKLPYSKTLVDESWFEYLGFHKESSGQWIRNGITGKSTSFFLTTKPSVTLDINVYYPGDTTAIHELIVTEDLNLSQPYDENLIPGDIDSISLTYTGYGSEEVTGMYPILDLTNLMNSLPARPDYVVLGGLPPGDPVYTLVFHSVSQGDITVECIAGGPDCGINIDGHPVLNDTKSMLHDKVSKLVRGQSIR